LEDRLFETLTVQADGAIGSLCLNRPDKLNPLSAETLAEIAAAARHFDTQTDVKVVIVRGAGRAFSAGADLASFGAPQQTLSTRDVAELGRGMADALDAMRAISIAAIRGWCIGGGFVMASACDLRLAAEGTRFSIPEVDLGIPLTWGGIPRLVREIGPTRTKELVLTCRVFDAEEAKSFGFLNEILPDADLDVRAQALAESLAKKSSHAIFSTKRHVNSITEQMVGMNRSWADADGIVAAFGDEESARARQDYLRNRR
jgi:enoyl-CoA hydratase/carnithine racemase